MSISSANGLILRAFPRSLIDMSSPDDNPCVVCDSSQTALIRTLQGQRTGRDWDVWFCQDCFSLSVKSEYSENEEDYAADLEWNIGKIERNTKYSRGLLKALLELRPGARSLLEVGCGIGTLLSIAQKEFDLSVAGYDINKRAVDWGNEEFGLKMKAENWDSSLPEKADLVLNLSCLEHVPEPRPLMKEMAAFAKREKAGVFITLPFFNPSSWKYLEEGADRDEGTIFHDNDVHVTLFSFLGLIEAMRQFGLPCFYRLNLKGWSGFLFVEKFPLLQRKRLQAESDRLLHRWKKASQSQLDSPDCPTCLRGLVPSK